MAKNTVADWSPTAASNTDVGGINIDENCAAANVNNAMREIMAQIADLKTSAVTYASLNLDSALPVLTLDDSNTATTHNKVAVQYNAESFRVQLRDDSDTAVASLFDVDADSAGFNDLNINTDVSQTMKRR